jgi:hypothetical protein
MRPDAEAPMTATTAMSPTLAEDPTVRAARLAVADLEREHEQARQRSRQLGAGTIQAPESREQREARERVFEIEDALGPARRAQTLAEQAARQRIAEAERPAVVEEARRLIALLEPLRVAVRETVAAQAARAVRGGFTMPAPFPVPELLGVETMIARLRRELDGPVPVAPAPVPVGKVRIRARVKFVDSDGRTHWPDDGAVDVLPAADLPKALAERWAVEVEG